MGYLKEKQMTNYTRTSRQQSQQKSAPKASRFIRNTGVVIELLSNGYLPIRHNSLPTPFKSFVVETPAGKRYVVQIRGQQAFELKLGLGNQVDYDGRFVFGNDSHGGYFLATFAKVVNTEMSEYVKTLIEAKRIIEQEVAAQ